MQPFCLERLHRSMRGVWGASPIPRQTVQIKFKFRPKVYARRKAERVGCKTKGSRACREGQQRCRAMVGSSQKLKSSMLFQYSTVV